MTQRPQEEYTVDLPYLRRKYRLTQSELSAARRNGLPYIYRNRTYWYNEDDLHAYYSGLIGYDVERASAARDGT